jgi:hypothetical protein
MTLSKILQEQVEALPKEQLADIEHQRWSDWQEYCNEVLREQVPKLGLEEVLKRWDRQVATPYSELLEREKDSDREQVDRYLPVIKFHLTQSYIAALEGVREFVGKEDLPEEMKYKGENNPQAEHHRMIAANAYLQAKSDLIQYIDSEITKCKESKE